MTETAVGTNGVGTVVACGTSLQVQGREHFADFYRDAVCTGAPVWHPMTGTLLAVVTLSSDVTPRADLLQPMLHTVVQTLQQHVLEMEEPAARRTFDAFLHIARSRPEPVVAFGDRGLLIQNRSAGSMTPEDLGRVQQLCADDPAAGCHPMTFSCGAVDVQITEVEPGNRVVVLRPDRRGPAINQVAAAPPRTPLIGRAADRVTARRQVEHLVHLVDLHRTRPPRRPAAVTRHRRRSVRQRRRRSDALAALPSPYGDGSAAVQIVRAMKRKIKSVRSPTQDVASG